MRVMFGSNSMYVWLVCVYVIVYAMMCCVFVICCAGMLSLFVNAMHVRYVMLSMCYVCSLRFYDIYVKCICFACVFMMCTFGMSACYVCACTILLLCV